MLTIAVVFALASLLLLAGTLASWHQSVVPGVGDIWLASTNTIVLAVFAATTGVFAALATVAWFLDARLDAMQVQARQDSARASGVRLEDWIEGPE